MALRQVGVGAAVAGDTVALTTRSGAYSFGGASGNYSLPGSIYAASRYRFMLPQAPTRLRVRYRNYDSAKDGASYTPAGFQVGKTYIGAESAGTPLAYAATPQLVDSTGTGAGTITGLTEYVTGWFTPTAGSLKPGTVLLLSHEFQNPSSSAAVVAWCSTSGGYLNTDHTAVNATAATGYVTYGSTPFEIVLEYEFLAPTAAGKVGLFVGHSFIDAASGSSEGWWGQHTGFPQQWSRRTGNVAVVNAYAGAVTADFGTTSQKWTRFPTVTPDLIFVSLIANDIINGASTSTAQASYTTLFSTVRAKYPGVPIYVALDSPYGLASGSAGETTRQAVITWLPTVTDSLGLAGVVDLDRVLRDPANTNLIAADFLSADNLHPKVRGYMAVADRLSGPGQTGSGAVAIGGATKADVAAAQAGLVGVNAQTGSYTTVLADAGQLITETPTAAATVTIPANATVPYPVGAVLSFANLSTFVVTIAGASGVTIRTPAGARITAQYGQASAVKIGTDTWLLSGQTVV